MTNHDVARWAAAKRILDFNQTQTHAAELAAIPDYDVEAAELQTLLQQVEVAATLQQQDTTGKTVSKATLRMAMANTLIMYTKRAIVKAHRLGNTELEQSLDHPASYYTHGSVAQSLTRALAMKDLLKTNLAILTNLSAADMTAIETAITAFDDAADAPQTAGQTKKVYGTDQISPLLDRIDTLIENMGNLIDSYAGGTNLANEFELRSRLIEKGVRSNSVTLLIQDATTAAPVAGAMATNERATKSALSTTGGVALFESIRTGVQQFTVSATGYATATVEVKVMRGTNTEMVVKMGK